MTPFLAGNAQGRLRPTRWHRRNRSRRNAGILFPPSIIPVIYGRSLQQSVPKLFAAGLIPACSSPAVRCGCLLVAHRRPRMLRPDPDVGARADRRAARPMAIPHLFLVTIGALCRNIQPDGGCLGRRARAILLGLIGAD